MGFWTLPLYDEATSRREFKSLLAHEDQNKMYEASGIEKMMEIVGKWEDEDKFIKEYSLGRWV